MLDIPHYSDNGVLYTKVHIIVSQASPYPWTYRLGFIREGVPPHSK